MKHANNRRSRGRSNGRRYPNQKGGVFESNGPEVKVRGTPQQVQEKYLALARDAQSSGDRVQAEAYFQHAEHYLRIMSGDDDDRDRGGRDQSYAEGNGHADDEPAQSNARSRDGDGEAAADDEAPAARGGDGAGGGNAGGSNGGGRGRGRGRGRRQAKPQDDGASSEAASNDPASQPQPDIVPPAAS